MELRDGPEQIVSYRCVGCKHLVTERWEEYLDNDETDSGTTARCNFKGMTIDTYWHSHHQTPSWCPLHPENKIP